MLVAGLACGRCVIWSVLASALATILWAGASALPRIVAHPAFDVAAPNASKRTHSGSDILYTHDGMVFRGYLSLPSFSKGQTVRPGALIAHQWMGLGNYEKSRADEMAALGFVAFALDFYGDGERCDEDRACALAQIARITADIPRLLMVIRAGVEQLLQAHGDPERLVAIGYCLGARVVLELARHPSKGASEGITFQAVSSIHGIYEPLGLPAAEGEIQTAVQVHHAHLDFQGDAGLAQLVDEMKRGVKGSSAEWESITYSKAAHSFTEPRLEVYRARAALQAHRSSFDFFRMAVGDLDPKADPFSASCGLAA